MKKKMLESVLVFPLLPVIVLFFLFPFFFLPFSFFPFPFPISGET